MSEFGERIVMICAVCKSVHHDSVKDVYVQGSMPGTYRKAKCPMCCCFDCVQLADDPLRAGLAPQMLGQTTATPFNIEQALNDMKGALGLVFEPKRHALPRSASCECGEPARSRCITCDEALCSRCVKGHKCQKKEGEGL